MLFISRFILIIPVLVIIIGVVLTVEKRMKGVTSTQIKQPITPLPKKVSPSTAVGSSSISLDLNGPWICKYSNTNMMVDVQIKNKNLSIRKKEGKTSNNYLLKDDCFYMWSAGIQGTKVCGLEQYITLYESLSSFGFGNVNVLIDKFFKDKTQNKFLVEDVIKTCKKIEVMNDENFFLPKEIKFQEQPVSRYLNP